MRFVHSVTMSPPRLPGDQSPGYRATPHQWGLKAGFSQRCFVARTLHVRAGCANLLPLGLVVLKDPPSHQLRNQISHLVLDINLEYDTNLSELIVDRQTWDYGLPSVLPIHQTIEEEGVPL